MAGTFSSGYTGNINLTDAASIYELNAITAKTTGVVTATLGAASLADLADLATASTDAITVTVSDADDTAIAAADLNALGGKTAATVTVSNAVAITGDHDQVTAALVTEGTKVIAATATVTINDADITAITAAELSAIGGKTSGTVTVSNAVAITGDTDDVIAALVTDATKVIASTASVTITGPITDAQYKAIDDATSGKVIRIDGPGEPDPDPNPQSITGNHDQIIAALEGVSGYTGVITITDADATSIAAEELAFIGAKTTGTVTVSNAVVISGTTDQVTAALVTADTHVVASDATVTLYDAATISELNAIAAKTNGVVTATLGAASLADLADLATASTDSITVTVSDADDTAIAAADLSALGGKTAVT